MGLDSIWILFRLRVRVELLVRVSSSVDIYLSGCNVFGVWFFMVVNIMVFFVIGDDLCDVVGGIFMLLLFICLIFGGN